jgi:hypothetical protein
VSGEGVREAPGRHGLAVWRRYMELPRYLRAVHGRPQLAAELEELCASLGFDRVALVSGATFTAELAHALGSLVSRAHDAAVGVDSNSEA